VFQMAKMIFPLTVVAQNVMKLIAKHAERRAHQDGNAITLVNALILAAKRNAAPMVMAVIVVPVKKQKSAIMENASDLYIPGSMS